MISGLRVKFEQPELKKMLLATGNAIICESSPYDSFWGTKCHMESAKILYPQEWKGQNQLGKCLMSIRDSFR